MSIPRYLYRGTTTLNYGGDLLLMHADPDPIDGFTDRIYFTDELDKARQYAWGYFGGNALMFEGSPMVLMVDTTKEPELRRALRKGRSEPNEFYVPVGILRLRHPAIVISIGNFPSGFDVTLRRGPNSRW